MMNDVIEQMTLIFLALCMCLPCVFTVTCRPGRRCLRDDCSSQSMEMNIVREKRITHQNVDRDVYCVGRVNVNKCDGSCVTSVTPSSYHGFTRVCKCCRDSGMRTRQVTLTECYDDNELLPDVTETTSITEPTSCSCQRCRN